MFWQKEVGLEGVISGILFDPVRTPTGSVPMSKGRCFDQFWFWSAVQDQLHSNGCSALKRARNGPSFGSTIRSAPGHSFLSFYIFLYFLCFLFYFFAFIFYLFPPLFFHFVFLLFRVFDRPTTGRREPLGLK